MKNKKKENFGMIYLIKEKKNTHKRTPLIRLRLSCVNAWCIYRNGKLEETFGHQD